MPALITAIKNWKSSKRIPKIEVAAEQTISADERIAKLEATIEKLTARIEALEKQQ